MAILTSSLDITNQDENLLQQIQAEAMAAYGGLPVPTVPDDEFTPSRQAEQWADFFDPPAPASNPQAQRGPGGFFLRGAQPPSSLRKPAEAKAGGNLGKRARPEDRERLRQLVAEILGEEPSPEDLFEAWTWAVAQVDQAVKFGYEGQTPWHWLEQRKGNETEGRGPRTITQRQRSFAFTDQATAEAVVDTTLRSLLGRSATDEESAQFWATLRGQEQANPTVSTSIQSYDETGALVGTETTTEGGAPDAATVAENWVDDVLGDEQKAMLAASYYDVLRQL